MGVSKALNYVCPIWGCAPFQVYGHLGTICRDLHVRLSPRSFGNSWLPAMVRALLQGQEGRVGVRIQRVQQLRVTGGGGGQAVFSK